MTLLGGLFWLWIVSSIALFILIPFMNADRYPADADDRITWYHWIMISIGLPLIMMYLFFDIFLKAVLTLKWK